MDRTAFIKKIENHIKDEDLIRKGDTVVLGVSGGADSVCLFEVMKELKSRYGLKLVVVCIDHGLRAEAKEEQRYVESLCEAAGIRFMGRSADVKGLAESRGLGTEEAGRILRYGIFEEVAESLGEGTKIAVAHNSNDVAETFLFNLFRGTGPKGLAAIKPKRGRVIRPLLCAERSEIEAYLNEIGVKFYTDASNLEDDYSRNRIRHHICEYAEKEINPSSLRHVYEAAERIRELNDLVDSLTEKSLAESVVFTSENEVVIKRSAVSEEEPYVAGLKVKKCIDMLVPHNKDITARHMKAVRDISVNPGTGKADLPYGIEVTASGDLLRFLRGGDEWESVSIQIAEESGSVYLDGLGTVSWHVEKRTPDFTPSQKIYTKCFDYDKINDCLSIRSPQPRDYLIIDPQGHKKKLSDYFTNEKVPVFEREKKFILADGDNVWWVMGMRIGEYPKVSDATEKIIIFHIDKEDFNGEASC